jgi:hypothetical protein
MTTKDRSEGKERRFTRFLPERSAASAREKQIPQSLRSFGMTAFWWLAETAPGQ